MSQIIYDYNPDVFLSSLSNNQLQIGQVLISRGDNTNTNGIIVDKLPTGFTVLTDYGNILRLTFLELEDIYDLSRSCVHVQDITNRVETQLRLLNKFTGKPYD